MNNSTASALTIGILIGVIGYNLFTPPSKYEGLTAQEWAEESYYWEDYYYSELSRSEDLEVQLEDLEYDSSESTENAEYWESEYEDLYYKYQAILSVAENLKNDYEDARDCAYYEDTGRDAYFRCFN